MTVSVYVPVALSVMVAAIIRLVAVRLSPTRGTLVTVLGAAVLCAAGTTWALVLLALTLLGFTPLAVEEASERGVRLVQPRTGGIERRKSANCPKRGAATHCDRVARHPQGTGACARAVQYCNAAIVGDDVDRGALQADALSRRGVGKLCIADHVQRARFVLHVHERDAARRRGPLPVRDHAAHLDASPALGLPQAVDADHPALVELLADVPDRVVVGGDAGGPQVVDHLLGFGEHRQQRGLHHHHRAGEVLLAVLRGLAGEPERFAPLQSEAEFSDPNFVKVVTDQDGWALYFSRAPIPWPRDGGVPVAMRHIGLYAYRAGSLRAISDAPPCALEEVEKLEQLRALWLGHRIVVGKAAEPPAPAVDTEEDLAKVRHYLETVPLAGVT